MITVKAKVDSQGKIKAQAFDPGNSTPFRVFDTQIERKTSSVEFDFDLLFKEDWSLNSTTEPIPPATLVLGDYFTAVDAIKTIVPQLRSR